MFRLNRFTVGIGFGILFFICLTLMMNSINIENGKNFTIGSILFIGWWTLKSGYAVGGVYGILQDMKAV